MLADEPRVGKTGAAIIACDHVWAANVLVITTSSGRGVWRRALREWSIFDLPISVLADGSDKLTAPRCVVSWGSITAPETRKQILAREWDVIILDESHYAKNFDAKRTKAVFGEPEDDGRFLLNEQAIAARGKAVWALTGTPMPNTPIDLYPVLRGLDPSRLAARGAAPDVTRFDDFFNRYVTWRPKKIGWHKTIRIPLDGKNLPELRARLDGFILRRTQLDVGIRPPIYETFPLVADELGRRLADNGADRAAILDAAERGDTRGLEMHLGPLRRITGELKVPWIVQAVKEELESGTDKIVLMHWHTEVGAALTAGIDAPGQRSFKAVWVDGSTPPAKRDEAVERFRTDPKCRVFVGQIQACGEAIDLSAAALLIFAESSFTPKDMAQAALRITNHSQRRQAVVRVATLAGSIDDALQAVLLRKWSNIREVLQ